MSSTTEASELVRRLALPAPAGDTTKAAISRAHRILKTWTWNRVRDVWHADPRISVSADELDQLRNLVRDRKYKGKRVRPGMTRLASWNGLRRLRRSFVNCALSSLYCLNKASSGNDLALAEPHKKMSLRRIERMH